MTISALEQPPIRNQDGDTVGRLPLESPLKMRSNILRARQGQPRLQNVWSGEIFAFAERLDTSEEVWLEARRHSKGFRSLAFSAGAALQDLSSQQKSRTADARFADLHQALSLELPHLNIGAGVHSYIEAPASVFPVVLRGLPIILPDLLGAPDPDLVAGPPRLRPEPKHVALGGCSAKSPLSEALQLLLALEEIQGFRLSLSRRDLSIHELQHLSKLYEDLKRSRWSQTQTAAEISRISDLAALVASWLAAKSGVAMRVSLIATQYPSASVLSAFSTAFSLPPSARRDSVDLALDLSGCFVSGQRTPSFHLETGVTRHLSPVALEPGTPANDTSCDCVGVTDDGEQIRLDETSRSRHLVVCGATGTGKSTLLRNLITSDIRKGHSIVLIDPHGDLYHDVLSVLNQHQDTPVWVANTAELDQPYSLNLFQSAGDAYRQNFVCNQLIRLLKRSLYKDVPEGFGPMFESYFRYAFLLLSDGGAGSYTISDMDRVFGDSRFRCELLEACGNQHVQRFWRDIASKAGGESALENIAPYIVSKLTQFVGNPVINPIVCTKESTIDFEDVFDSGGACLINLAKGKIGSTETEILGGMLTTALFSAALQRGSRPREERQTVRIYLDEFQSYAGEVVGEMLAECRKYGLELTLATQSLNRIRHMNGDLTQSILGNTANIIALRSGPDDADLLSHWIGGEITRQELMSLDDFSAVGRFLERGRMTLPVNFHLLEAHQM